MNERGKGRKGKGGGDTKERGDVQSGGRNESS